MNANSSSTVPIRKVSWVPGPGLLVSARSLAESKLVLAAGAMWLDIKEPNLGSLGRPPLDLIFSILDLEIPEGVQVSIAGGELKDWTGDLDHLLAARLPARSYLKLALADCVDTNWQVPAERISRALTRRSQLILVHYADTASSRSPSWQEIIETTKSLGGKFVLIDTHGKKSGGLLEHYSMEQLEQMIQSANQLKLGIALAGSIQLDQLKRLSKLQADWLGVRGAVCQDTLRTSELCPNRLKQAIEMVTPRPHNGN